MQIKGFAQPSRYFEQSPSVGGLRPMEESSGNQPMGRSVDQTRAAPGDDTGRVAASDNTSSAGSKSGKQVTNRDMVEIAQLRTRDVEVRAHEQAHIAAGGRYVRGGPKYELTEGPDGHQYAVGGEVSIDASPIPDDPQGTIEKMQVVKRAALAPAQPSSQDRQVAAAAEGRSTEARLELIRRTLAKIKEAQEGSHSGTKGNSIDTTA